MQRSLPPTTVREIVWLSLRKTIPCHDLLLSIIRIGLFNESSALLRRLETMYRRCVAGLSRGPSADTSFKVTTAPLCPLDPQPNSFRADRAHTVAEEMHPHHRGPHHLQSAKPASRRPSSKRPATYTRRVSRLKKSRHAHMKQAARTLGRLYCDT